MSDDTEPLLSSQTSVLVYKRRWWILGVFCVTCSLQSMIWNTWGPIAESAEIVLQWSDGNIALISNLANISYMLLVLPLCVLMDTKGLKFSMLLCICLLMTASVIRCFSLDPLTATITAYMCGFIQGIAATIPFSGPPLVAAVWFPPSQRPVATAIGSFFNYLGVSLSFIIGPQLVPGPIYEELIQRTTNESATNTSKNNDNGPINFEEMSDGIKNLLYTHSIIAVTTFVLIVGYFPSRPTQPPSITASIPRTSYKQALANIVRNVPLWIVVIAGSSPVGVIGVWIAILDVALKPLGVSQIDAGWMGFWHTLIGCFAGIVIARFSEFFNRKRKIFIITMFVLATICCVWLNLICSEIIDFDLRSLYASCILFGIFVNGTTPLFYEMCVETSYPVAEGVTGGWYTFINNIFGMIFLSLVSVPSIGTAWMNWAVLGSIVIAIPLLFAFRERYKRTEIDLGMADT
ncbi:hypothetical protein ACF0H5_006662 [Mactra antiquata]